VTIQALVIGIGSGNPDHLTREAVAALNRVDVFLVADKGAAKRDLVKLREEICHALISHDDYRIIEVPDPPRDASDYAAGVTAWHEARAQQYAEIITADVADGGTVGFLVWGDPAFYDSTIRIVESITQFGIDLELSVIPGISSIQLLAARHKIILNRVGQPIHVTTGRRLLEEYSAALGDVVVMLDGDLACSGLLERFGDLMIYWGAQLGLPDETLVSGCLSDVIDEIRAKRAARRDARGWVMDTYLLRPPHDGVFQQSRRRAVSERATKSVQQ
jgi:precorrin-6A synthase